MLFVNGVVQIVYWKNADFFFDFLENLIVGTFVKPNLPVNKHYIKKKKNIPMNIPMLWKASGSRGKIEWNHRHMGAFVPGGYRICQPFWLFQGHEMKPFWQFEAPEK